MKKIYKQPHSIVVEVDLENMIADSLTGDVDGLGYGGASPRTAGEDVGGDVKSRVDFSKDFDDLW